MSPGFLRCCDHGYSAYGVTYFVGGQMKYFQISLISMMVTAFGANAAGMNMEMSQPYTNTHLSSGSGAVVNDGNILVVGDDMEWLFSVDKDYQIVDRYSLSASKTPAEGRMKKKIKPDFESMTKLKYQGQEYYLVLGSGSKKGKREKAILMAAGDHSKQILSLSPLYQSLYEASGMSGKQKLNIEGVANSDDMAYLFNRGNEGKNIVFSIKLDQMMDFISGKSDSLTSLSAVDIELPSIKGFDATLSGADFWPEANSIVYSASVEGTDTAVGDGKVLGSFIGVLPADKLTGNIKVLDLTQSAQQLTHNGQAVITKVESVAIDTSNQHGVQGYLVSDNDDGTSQFFSFTIKAD